MLTMAPAPRGIILREHVFQAKEDAFTLTCMSAVERIVRIFVQRRDHALDPRIVGENADRPELALDRLDEGRGLLRTGDIGADRHRPAAGRFHEARGLASAACSSISTIGDGLAHPRQPQRDGAADVAAAAGDERHRPVVINRRVS